MHSIIASNRSSCGERIPELLFGLREQRRFRRRAYVGQAEGSEWQAVKGAGVPLLIPNPIHGFVTALTSAEVGNEKK